MTLVAVTLALLGALFIAMGDWRLPKKGTPGRWFTVPLFWTGVAFVIAAICGGIWEIL
jgi:hypothetical protein